MFRVRPRLTATDLPKQSVEVLWCGLRLYRHAGLSCCQRHLPVEPRARLLQEEAVEGVLVEKPPSIVIYHGRGLTYEVFARPSELVLESCRRRHVHDRLEPEMLPYFVEEEVAARRTVAPGWGSIRSRPALVVDLKERRLGAAPIHRSQEVLGFRGRHLRVNARMFGGSRVASGLCDRPPLIDESLQLEDRVARGHRSNLNGDGRSVAG
jgi:hypothetical protein